MNETNGMEIDPMAGYSILVNTCDKFEDCWEPFFKLFALHWPEFTGKLYLNTERKDYAYPGLDVVALKVCRDDAPDVRPTWSECLLRALDRIDDEIVLYVQEDYFLNGAVQVDVVAKHYAQMRENPDIHCIHFNDQAVAALGPSKYEGLYDVVLEQRYRCCCQTAFWRKDVLRSYIRAYEAAWQFELYGSKRGKYLKHNFYVVDPTVVKKNIHEIIPYCATGVVQGRWYEDVPPLFAKHGIAMDYSKRGFLNDAPPKPLPRRARDFVQRIPTIVKSNLELLQMKFSGGN